MIITCENCHTRFRIDPTQVGKNGRFFRCSKCDHEWLFHPPAREEEVEEPTISNVAISSPEARSLSSIDLLNNAKAKNLRSKHSRFFSFAKKPRNGLRFDNTAHTNDSPLPDSNPPVLHQQRGGHLMLYLFSTVLFCIVGLFTLGMHFVDVLEDRFPSFASYYHKIGVYGGHKLAVTEIMVLPIATQQDLVYTDSDSDSNMQKLLEITVLNRGTTAHLLAKIQVIMYTAEGQITKIAPIVAGFMMPPQRSRTIKAKVTIPATAASLSVVLDNRTVIKGYQLGRVPE